MEVDLETIKNTQTQLGKFIKKPPLTEKLLKKPPFRFLHDLVANVIKETGFLKGLYSEDELKSENIKDKEAKIAFLNKLIDAVKAISEPNLSVRATKIIAGLEPTETNLLLQAIAKAIDKKLDSTEYVKKLNSEKPTKSKVKRKISIDKTSDTTKKSTSKTSTKSSDTTIKKKTSSKSSEESAKLLSTNRKTKAKKDDTKKLKEKSPKSINPSPKTSTKINKTEDTKTTVKEKVTDSPKLSEENIETEDNKEINVIKAEPVTEINTEILSNPTPIDPAATEEENKVAGLNESHPSDDAENDEKTNKLNVLTIEKKDEEKTVKNDNIPISNINEDKKVKVERPKSSLRPPSIRPSSARPGAPRLRPDSSLLIKEKEVIPLGKINLIVENFADNNSNDEESVTIQNTSEEVDYQPQDLHIPESKGHLVEQILEQIEEIEPVKSKTNIDWNNSKDNTSKETEQLRSLIQVLTRTANPLGKLLGYLHEDIEAMHNEIEMWINVKQQMKLEITKQKRMSTEFIEPLKSTLKTIEEDIAKQEQEIVSIRSNIFRNETLINKLLNNTSTK